MRCRFLLNPCGKTANFKGGDLHHNQQLPFMGQAGVRWNLPLQGKASVACDQAVSGRTGLVSQDRSANAWPESHFCRLVRFTYRIE